MMKRESSSDVDVDWLKAFRHKVTRNNFDDNDVDERDGSDVRAIRRATRDRCDDDDEPRDETGGEIRKKPKRVDDDENRSKEEGFRRVSQRRHRSGAKRKDLVQRKGAAQAWEVRAAGQGAGGDLEAAVRG